LGEKGKKRDKELEGDEKNWREVRKISLESSPKGETLEGGLRRNGGEGRVLGKKQGAREWRLLQLGMLWMAGSARSGGMDPKENGFSIGTTGILLDSGEEKRGRKRGRKSGAGIG